MSDINAFSKYNNEVKNLKNDFNPSGFLNDLISKVSALSNVQITKLNSLLSKFSVNLPFKSSAGKEINTLLNDQINKLKITTTETISNLSNASISFAGNIVENFINDLTSYSFIADSATVKTVELLYNTGGDLSYENDYVREQALVRDWNYTLKFIDENLKIIYNAENKQSLSDIEKMSKNCCKNNITYVFDIIYKEYLSLNSTINSNQSVLNTYDPESEGYKRLEEFNNNLKKYLDLYANIMIKNTKILIVNSFDYLTLKDFQNIFSKYPEVLKPKYFGDNDDVYGNEYTFSDNDIEIMAPFWTSHGDTSVTDEAIIESNIQNTSAQIQEAKNNNDKIYENYLDQKKRYNNNLPSNISNGGINTLYEERASYNKNSSGSTNSKFTIQYKNEPIINLEKNVYIDPRNSYIKQIYVYLTSSDIHGDSRMVHENLYQRLRYPYMTSAKASLDKALSYISSGPLATNLLKTVDSIESSIYKYIKTMDKYFLDPQYHNKAINQGILDVSVSSPNDVPTESVLGDAPSPNINGVNINTVDIITLADNDPANTKIKTELNNIIRFIDNISAVEKMEMYKKYITSFYEYCETKGLDTVYIEDKFEKMIVGIFNRTLIRSIDDFDKIFYSMSTEYLNESLITIVSILFYNKEINCFDWESEEDSIILEGFKLFILLLTTDIYISGFIRTIYLYDNGQLSSGVKKYFNIFIELCSSINTLDNSLYNLFYTFKDTITNIMHGFDEFGILYIDDKYNIHNTNVVVGDFNKIFKTVDGTFFLGTKTSNAGILKLSSNNEIVESNITTGEWIDCFEINNFTFFQTDSNEIYVWDKNKNEIIDTMLDNEFLNDFEILNTVSNGNNIFVTSKTEDIGIKKFNINSFTFTDTNITTGSQWKILDGLNGIFVYSPVSDGIYKYNNSEFEKLTDPDSAPNYFNSTIEFVENVSVTSTTTDPETGGTVQSVDITQITYTAFGSNNNKGIKLITDKNTKSLFKSKVTTGNIQFITYYGTDYVIDPYQGNIGLVTKKLNNANTSLNQNILEVSYFYDKGKSLSVLLEGRNGLYILAVETISSNDNNILYTVSPYNSEIISKINGLTSEQLKNVIMLDNYNKNHTILHGSNIEGLFTIYKNELECKKVSYSSNIPYENSKDWNIIVNDSDTYISNNEFNNEVIKVLNVTESINNLVNTNLFSNKWEIVDFNGKGFALSINGNNKGILKKDSSTIFSPTRITYNDFKPYYIDNSNKIAFIGNYRLNGTLINIQTISYNIDEYIYYMSNLDKQNVIIDLVRNFIDVIRYNITDTESILNTNNISYTDLILFISNMLSLLLSVEQSVSNYSLLGNKNDLLNSGISPDFNIDDPAINRELINSILLNSTPSDNITNIILGLIGLIREVEAFDVELKISDYPNIEEYTVAYNNRVNTLDMCENTYLDENPYDSIIVDP